MRAGHTEPFRQLLLRGPQVLQQLLERLSKLQRAEVLAVQVLDQRFAKSFGVVAVADDGRDGGQSGEAGRAQPPLPRHELVATVPASNHHRLQHTYLADRRGERLERIAVEAPARLFGVGSDGRHRHLQKPRFLCRAGNQRAQSAAEPSLFHVSLLLENTRNFRFSADGVGSGRGVMTSGNEPTAGTSGSTARESTSVASAR